MPQTRKYQSNAERQAAYNERLREKRREAERQEQERLKAIAAQKRLARREIAVILQGELRNMKQATKHFGKPKSDEYNAEWEAIIRQLAQS